MPLLGYWNVRGNAQPIRLMLGYLEVDFEEKLYHIGDAPDFSLDDWRKEKYTLGVQRSNDS